MSSILARAPGFKPGGFPRGESGGGLLPTPLGKNLPPQPVHNPVNRLSDRHEALPSCQGPRASVDLLRDVVVALHGTNHGGTVPKPSFPDTGTPLDRHSIEAVEAEIAPVVHAVATAVPIKQLARDADVSETHAKQIRAGDTLPGVGPLILLARRYPALRERLVALMHAEIGEGGKSPAEILADIVRMVTR